MCLATSNGLRAVMYTANDFSPRSSFGADTVIEEHVLVPKPGSRREGEGWLLGMGYDIVKKLSFASIFDAEAISAGPVARVWLPYWLPYGFHGRFYAA